MTASYHLAHASIKNTKSATVGHQTFNVTKDTFVLVDQELDLTSLQRHFRIFHDRLRRSLAQGFSHSVSNFRVWNPDEVEERRIAQKGDFLMAFKPVPGTIRLQYFRQGPILNACIQMELMPAHTPHGKARTNAPKGSGGLPKFVAALPLQTQKEVLDRAFAETKNLDDLISLAQGNSFDFDRVESALHTAPDAWSALTQILPNVSEFIEVQHTKWAKGVPGRSFGAPLFFAYLAGAGVLLWPIVDRQMVYLVPDILRPLWWEVVGPQPMRPLIQELSNARGNERATTTLRRLILTTDIFVAPKFEAEQFRLLLAIKHEIMSQRDDAAEKHQHEINVIVRLILRFTGRTMEDISEIAANFGGGRRTTTPETLPFGWVELPSKGHKKHLKIFGTQPPEEYNDKIHLWAAYLRDLLPGFQTRSLKQKKEALEYWLYYLTTLPPDSIPDNFEDLQRPIHIINSDPTQNTFTSFIRARCGTKARRVLADIAQAWKIAAKTHNFSHKHNPIDPKLDAPDGDASSVLGFHTRRRSMSEAQVALLREINTRNDFEFARSLGRFEKKTAGGGRVFWPALPILLELILSMALRSHSAIWADSGEGDEFWPGDDANFPNPLPTATRGRQYGLLQRHQIDTDVWVMGMRIQVVKTNPFSTPWIDPDLVRPIKLMRDWQIQHNPRRSPVIALRDPQGADFNPSYDYPKVFPLFRDPENPTGRPPTWSTVNRYWIELLAAAEAETNSNLPDGQRVTFLVDEKPNWDLHSLRVSFVTNARDAGIPLEAVRLITGQTAPMASYYDVHESVRAHQAFVRAKEAERERIVAKLKSSAAFTSEAEIDDFIGTSASRSVDSHVGLKMLHWAVKSGREVQVFAHGICPAARCDKGNGEGSDSKPVFRPFACSRCQYRVTGALFVNGLAIRANALAIEQFRLMEEIRELNRQLRDAEDQGRSARGYLDAIECKSDELEEVNKEWSVEYATCKLAERQARNWDAKGEILPTESHSPRMISLERAHPLTLIQATLDASEVIAGGSLFIPPGTEEMRNNFLYRISHHNRLDDLLVFVDPAIRRIAMNKFGQVITMHAHLASTDPAAYIADLIDGSVKFDPKHRINDKLSTVIKALTKATPKELV